MPAQPGPTRLGSPAAQGDTSGHASPFDHPKTPSTVPSLPPVHEGPVSVVRAPVTAVTSDCFSKAKRSPPQSMHAVCAPDHVFWGFATWT